MKILLDALELARKRVHYFALDLSKPELERTLSAVPEQYQYVRCHGLLGTVRHFSELSMPKLFPISIRDLIPKA